MSGTGMACCHDHPALACAGPPNSASACTCSRSKCSSSVPKVSVEHGRDGVRVGDLPGAVLALPFTGCRAAVAFDPVPRFHLLALPAVGPGGLVARRGCVIDFGRGVLVPAGGRLPLTGVVRRRLLLPLRPVGVFPLAATWAEEEDALRASVHAPGWVWLGGLLLAACSRWWLALALEALAHPAGGLPEDEMVTHSVVVALQVVHQLLAPVSVVNVSAE